MNDQKGNLLKFFTGTPAAAFSKLKKKTYRKIWLLTDWNKLEIYQRVLENKWASIKVFFNFLFILNLLFMMLMLKIFCKKSKRHLLLKMYPQELFTLSDKNLSGKIVKIQAWCRKFCLSKNSVRRNFCPIFKYKSQAKIGQNCRNFGLVSKILSSRIFCPTKILSDKVLTNNAVDSSKWGYQGLVKCLQNQLKY